jgi:hypothetical protein
VSTPDDEREANIVYGHDLSLARSEAECEVCFLIRRLREARRAPLLPEMAEALRQIAGGNLSGASIDALIAGDWHPAVTECQKIAGDALARYDAAVKS